MIHLYAEHLLNIRTISIQAALSTVSNKETKATLSADGTILTLNHEGESASIQLPINLSPNRQSQVSLTIPAIPCKDLTFRVQLEENDGMSNSFLSNAPGFENVNLVPWDAVALTPEIKISCSSCCSELVKRGAVREWKDLPSEGWAEMMDFWHCHKPHEPNGHEPGQFKKGYAANSRLALEEGVGLVDRMNFLLAPSDCKNISRLDPSTPNESTSVLMCCNCEATIGAIDSATQGYRLRKLSVSLSKASGRKSMAFDAGKWFSSLLLENMDSQGTRKFALYEQPSSSQTMKVWIFTPDLTVSSSARLSTDPVRVARMLWRDDESESNGDTKLNGTTLSQGEIKLFDGELSLLSSLLKRSSEMLPEDARKFQDWHVGVLERFTSADIG